MDWVILDVVIGLSFLFFLLSVIAAAMNEAIAGVFKLRARMLEQGIINLINGTPKPENDADLDIVRQLYEHSLVNGYYRGKSKPSYLASRSFRNALFDVTGLLEATSEPSDDPLQAAAIRARVEETLSAVPNAELQKTLTAIWNSCHHDATEFRAGVERWFDRGMERVSGWYKRRTQLILFVLGIGVAIALNASALQVADELWRNDGVRDALVAQVENQGEEASGTVALDELKELQFPVGWYERHRPQDFGEWLVALAGWLLTGFAVTFGAPFWFDVLGRFSNLRAAGKKPADVLPPSPSPPEVSTIRLTVDTDR